MERNEYQDKTRNDARQTIRINPTVSINTGRDERRVKQIPPQDEEHLNNATTAVKVSYHQTSVVMKARTRLECAEFTLQRIESRPSI